ncbi:hypothetical protein MNBD_GAMMA09-1523 [hydrothermal vent metagenome]|uniref:Transmembrane protein n=1 Tax=hydrothermal vent metagenome TaxID=652676 RepID=A0A3B0XGQ0_9ZZZZ
MTNLLAILMPAVMAWSSSVYSDTTREYQLKAAYLLNFARFIYWPPEVFSEKSSNFYICVYGDNPFGESLKHLSNKKIQNKKIKFMDIKNSKGKESCHIVYISESEKDDYLKVIDRYSNKTVLIVSDISGFSRSGGMIEFIRIKNKIKFEINTKTSGKAGIKYRSQLLKVANKVR